jgi:hypothetical protein
MSQSQAEAERVLDKIHNRELFDYLDSTDKAPEVCTRCGESLQTTFEVAQGLCEFCYDVLHRPLEEELADGTV